METLVFTRRVVPHCKRWKARDVDINIICLRRGNVQSSHSPLPQAMLSPSSRPKRSRPDPSAILRGHTSALSSLRFLSYALIASGDESGLLRLWHVSLEESVLSHRSRTPSPLLAIAQDPAAPQSLTLHYKAGAVVVLDLARDDSAVDLASWRLRASRPLTSALSMNDDALLAESFCPLVYLREHVLVGPVKDARALAIFDTRVHDKAVTTLPCPSSPRTKSANLSMRSARTDAGMLMALERVSEHRLLSGYEDGSVSVWDVRGASSAPVSQILVGDEAVTALAVAPLGSVAVAGGAFSSLSAVADVDGSELGVVRRVRVRGKGVAGMAWRGDGKVMASAGWDGRVRVWEGRRRREGLLRKVGSLKWHEGGVSCVAYGGEGGVLASGGKDRTVALWRGIG